MRIIAGEWRGRRLRGPPGRAARPTGDRVREAWMSALQLRLPGARVLDLFAGSGALGLEALSRGAREAVFVERSSRVARVLRENVATLGAGDRARIVRADVPNFLNELPPGEWFDIALADPPYDTDLARRVVTRYLTRPFAQELWVEHRSSERMPPAPGAERRDYGDTALSTFVPSGETEEES